MDIFQISTAFDDIISGLNVKRIFQKLEYNSIDYTDLFIERLKYHNYITTIVSQIKIDPGYRIPGFLLQNKSAIFGYVFWEIFNINSKRKLWGSLIQNKKGDWKYTVSEKSKRIIWINPNQIEEINLLTYGLAIN
jgi:hypothetical protein